MHALLQEGSQPSVVIILRRHDASLAAAELALEVEKATLEAGAEDAVGTTGHWQASPCCRSCL